MRFQTVTMGAEKDLINGVKFELSTSKRKSRKTYDMAGL
jgi:hypothetical protein